MEREFCLINWTVIPPFLKEAVIEFPFESTDNAQDFSDLMMSRMRGRLLQAPEPDDSEHRIRQYLDSIEAELVCSITSDSGPTNRTVVSWGEICRQMLLCQFSDQTSWIL